LILGECRKLKGDLSVELQAAKDDRKELQQLTNELWETLQKIQAQFRVEAQLMNLIKPLEKGGGNIRNQGNETINLRLTKGRKKSSQ
jgi:hypothetical protein